MMDTLKPVQDMLGPYWVLVWTLVKIVAILVPLLLSVAYMTYWERKILAWMHVRLGPNRIGPWGLLQPFADALKMLFKEIIIPSQANKTLFFIGPVLAIAPALAAWAVVPFSDGYVLANIGAGVLYLLAISSVGVYSGIIAGWASNSKYAFLGAMRMSAQMISYEIAMGFALVGALMAAQSLNLTQVSARQDGAYGMLEWFFIPLFPLFVIQFIAGVAETNRHPFDVAEGESEIVAGPLVEYSGMTWSMFFLAEYANMLMVATLSTILFMGGWLSPFPRAVPFLGEPGIWWMFGKMAVLMFIFLWIRASFPRYRYDQIMRLGWKIFIPITIVWIVVTGVMLMEPVRDWAPFSIWFGK